MLSENLLELDSKTRVYTNLAPRIELGTFGGTYNFYFIVAYIQILHFALLTIDILSDWISYVSCVKRERQT